MNLPTSYQIRQAALNTRQPPKTPGIGSWCMYVCPRHDKARGRRASSIIVRMTSQRRHMDSSKIFRLPPKITTCRGCGARYKLPPPGLCRDCLHWAGQWQFHRSSVIAMRGCR